MTAHVERSVPRPAGAQLRALLAAAVALIAGCASIDPYAHAPMRDRLERSDAIGDCARLLQRVDNAIDAAGVRDAEAARLKGHPYLRADRLLAALEPRDVSSPAAAVWLDRLRNLDHAARRAELSNAATALDAADAARAQDCATQLAGADLQARTLPKDVHVDDHYSIAMRTLGVYPLTRVPFAAGVRRWQQLTVQAHAQPLPARGPTQRWRSAASSAATQAPSSFMRDALGVPVLSQAVLAALFARHAPDLEIETIGDADRVGAIAWGPLNLIEADVREPVAYTRLAHARLGERIVPQLVYTFWFPSRPAQRSVDLLAGRIDGIVWRVTLGDDLQSLVYDTIHPCGCYHIFYATERVRARPPGPDVDPIDEGLFMPQRDALPAQASRLRLRVEATSHAVVGVAPSTQGDASGIAYALRDEHVLRALPLRSDADRRDAGAVDASRAASSTAPRTRSAYGSDGLIAGTERLERFLFWPMGIDSAGQMRQWGHHATAFVGRRHFDDPDLLDRYFEVINSGGVSPQVQPRPSP